MLPGRDLHPFSGATDSLRDVACLGPAVGEERMLLPLNPTLSTIPHDELSGVSHAPVSVGQRRLPSDLVLFSVPHAPYLSVRHVAAISEGQGRVILSTGPREPQHFMLLAVFFNRSRYPECQRM